MSQVHAESSLENDPSIRFGKILTNPPPEDEVVISGMSGVFPLSDNIEEFKENLFNKVNLISPVPKTHPEMPTGFGIMKDKSKFDAGFFDIPKRQAKPLSIFIKVLLEKTYECIVDAGLHPSDLEGTNTGVFLGLCFTEFEIWYYLMEHIRGGNTILGNLKGAAVNKISEYFKLKGPSYITDTACSSGGYALENAYRAIRMGHCDAAIVGASNFIMAGGCSLQFARLGVLSPTGECRPFDESGLGYVRSEATVAMLLQKAKDCNRIYARIIHAKTNCDGFKHQGITYPSGAAQFNLLKEVYFESGIEPTEISYIEAHGTGTLVGDPEELNSVDEFFTPGRKGPLLIGSVKSSIGHSEPTATLCSTVKVLLAFETGSIPPNINYKTPRKNLKGILEGRLKVVAEATPFQDDNGLAGVSSFGFGGGNAHIILQRSQKIKTGDGKPSDNLPRIVCVSGRTEEAIDAILNDVSEKFDEEHIALIHNVFRKYIPSHLFRGFAIVSRSGVLKKSVKQFVGFEPLIIHFGDSTNFSRTLMFELLNLPMFSAFKAKLSEYFQSKEINLRSLLANNKSDSAVLLTNLLAHVIAAELLRQLDVVPESVTAHSVGNLSKCYFKGIINLEQFLDCAIKLTRLFETDRKQANSNGFLIHNLGKHRTRLLEEFYTVFRSNGTMNGYATSQGESDFPESLLDSILSTHNGGLPITKKRSIVLVIGELGVSKRASENNTICLTDQEHFGGILQVIGRLFEGGQHPQVQRLYPAVQFPVSRGTPMIAPTIKWIHDFSYFIPTFGFNLRTLEIQAFNINIEDEEWASLNGHVVDGRILFPATGYLFLAWNVFADINAIDLKVQKVVFRDCKFIRACQLSKGGFLALEVMVQRLSGRFEILEQDVPVMMGHLSTFDGKLDKLTNNTQGVEAPQDEHPLEGRDIYKELRLRGYNYKGAFKSLVQSNKAADSAKVKWVDNWIAFMDNLLQMKILGEDTRLLYVPTRIGKVIIDPVAHLEEVALLRQENEENPVTFTAKIDYRSGVIRSGGIELRGLLASSIPRKKVTAIPVLEEYKFIPNVCKLQLEAAVRVFMQIALENHCGLKVTAVEVIDDFSTDNIRPIAPIIGDALEDQPLVQADVSILSAKVIETDIKVQKGSLKEFADLTVVVGSQLCNGNILLQEAVKAITENGFLITRESLSFDSTKANIAYCDIVSIVTTGEEKLLFLRKKTDKNSKPRVFLNISNKTNDFKWLNRLKAEIKSDRDLILWCQDEPLNGLIGLVNCIRREPDTKDVRGLFIVDKEPAFDPNSPFYKQQLDKELGINVLANGFWGTYRHLLLDNPEEIENEHCFANSTIRGDLSSIKWIEGPLSRKTVPQDELLEVYYSSLNFRDVMTASGRINVDVITHDRREQECVQGFEYSGITQSGQRIMGMLSQGTLATLIKVDRTLLWSVPSSWTLKEAATVPVVYATCLYALVVVGKLKPGAKVLIHSGTGGIGQAAINLCLGMGCTVFTTVGTQEKRDYIKKNFPKINERHVGNSRDLSFEQLIMKETNGLGVDIILNSLAEEKLMASARCLSQNGRFLEIGKFDLANDNRLQLLSFRKGGSYHGVMLDKIFNESDSVKMELNKLLQKYIDLGAVKPLNATVFSKAEVEKAFRFMTTGKHMGKVLVEIRNEDLKQHPLTFRGLPRYFCDSSKSYIICGGLGGFGLELADWLIIRGAKHLVLTSRRGVSTGYQSYRISIWKSYGCNIRISTQDITTKPGCEALIKEANSIAPVGAIFNLAVVLRDALLSNQNQDSFETSFGPKACATQHLDDVTRRLCPELQDFVIFSSVSCGRGNAGQTNYGMSNSVMERICERRHRDGYPALAIQWGAVGDVGLVAEMQEDHVELEIGGTLQQSISSCLQVMDTLLRQHDAPIVSSMVVAEKKSCGSSSNIMEVVAGLLGIRDLKSVSQHSTLAELGMDSMNAVEVKQTLEREFNIFLSANEIRKITLARIQELQEDEAKVSDSEEQEAGLDWVGVLSNLMKNEGQTSCVIKLKTKPTTRNPSTLPKIIAFPGIEGVCNLLEGLTELLEVQAFGINYISSIQEESYPEMVEKLLPEVLKLLTPKEPFHLLAHSVGSVVVLEVAQRLEKLGYEGTITLLDGSPALMKELATRVSEDNVEDKVAAFILQICLDQEDALKAMMDIVKCTNSEEKIALLAKMCIHSVQAPETFFVDNVRAIIKRLRALLYDPVFDKMKSKVFLAKPTLMAMRYDAEDYELGQYFHTNVDVKVFEGTHTNFLHNVELAQSIMDLLSHGRENNL